MELNDWLNFWEVFRLSILTSLLGALIGHYANNGVIQFPLFVIPYERGEWVEKSVNYFQNQFLRILTIILLTPFDFAKFLLGIRSSAGNRTFLELGLLGDILIGVGTGVLAKTATEMAETTSDFAEISAAFIAGFAGLSYIRKIQNKDLGISDEDGKLDPSEVAQTEKEGNSTNLENTTSCKKEPEKSLVGESNQSSGA